MDTWEVKEDYPFSTNKYVHWYFEFAENPLNILRIIQYATVSTDESVLIVGGFTVTRRPDRTTIIAEYKDGIWSNIGTFSQHRDTHGAINTGSVIMIAGGWPMSGSS